MYSSTQVIRDRIESQTPSTIERYSEVMLESGASVELSPKVVKVEAQLLDQLKAVSVKDRGNNKFVVKVSLALFKLFINVNQIFYLMQDNFFIQFDGIQNKLEIPVLRADKRFFSLKHRKESSEEWGVISDVMVENGSTFVTLRSVLQVYFIKIVLSY